MKAVWITKHGGLEVLQVREQPDPEPGAGQVRIRVRAAGLNFAEMMARQGLYPDAPKPPFIPGYEVAGVIDALGADVGGLSIGMRVLALIRFGAHADTAIAPAAQVRELPEAMSFEEGGALPVVYLTAYHMLFRVSWLRAGMRVLIHSAGGSVGLAALQLCKTVPGVETFGTASAGKHAHLRECGLDHPIDYRTQDYEAEIKRITNGKGVDLVLDALGGDDWKKGYRLLRPGGQLIAFGASNMASGETRNLFRVAKTFLSIPRWSPLALMDQNKGIAGVNIGHLWNEPELLGEELDALLALYREGKIKPTVDSTFTFEKVADAHRHMQERKNVGKIVLVP